MSLRWLQIISSPGRPEMRLEKLMNLWEDCIHKYYAGTLQTFDKRHRVIVTADKRNRIPEICGTGSVIRMTVNQPSYVDRMMEEIIQDDRDVKLVKAFARIFNSALNEEERQLVQLKYFSRKTRMQICEEVGMSLRTYHRKVKVAEQKLIMEYCLDFCDETGLEKETWVDIVEDRKQWTGGVIRKQDRFIATTP